MRSVAATLERRHASAVKVRLAKRRGLVPAGNHVTPAAGDDVSADQLVFYTISPDYCLPDRSVGSAGTRHRWTITHTRTHTHTHGVHRRIRRIGSPMGTPMGEKPNP